MIEYEFLVIDGKMTSRLFDEIGNGIEELEARESDLSSGTCQVTKHPDHVLYWRYCDESSTLYCSSISRPMVKE